MTNASHTPGPWSYEISANRPDYFLIHEDAMAIAEVERWNGDGDDTDAAREAEANARLISAAPELLALAQCALDYLDGQEYLQACAIIAKATGAF